jgi:O-antigen ligase
VQGTGSWIIGGLVALAGLIGLFLAADAVDRGIYVFGLGLFAFAVLFVFSQIKHAFDARDAARVGLETDEH